MCVIPVKTGIQKTQKIDSHFRGNDKLRKSLRGYATKQSGKCYLIDNFVPILPDGTPIARDS
jgi:hypothetical protein